MTAYGSIVNLLDEDTQLLNTGVGLWQQFAEVPGDISRTSILDGDLFAENTLAVTTDGVNVVAIFATLGPISNTYKGWPLRFHLNVATNPSALPAQINASVVVEGDGAGTWVAYEAEVNPLQPGKFHLVDVLTERNETNFFPTLQSNASVIVAAVWPEEETGTKVLYVKEPTVSVPLAVRFNLFAAETWLRLPEYLQDGDREPSVPDYPLLRFIDVITAIKDSAYAKWEEFRYLPPEDNERILKSSSLTDPEKASIETLIWLAQFLGIEFIDPRIGATSWESLLFTADPTDGIPEWGQFITNIDAAANPDPPGPAGDGLLQWNEIQELADDISPEVLLAFFRWQVSSAAYGLRGGTNASLKSAARQGLTDPNAPVAIIPNDGGDPFKIRVQVQTADIADQVVTIEGLLAPSTPAGYEIEVEAI